MKLLAITDPIDTLNPKKDSTIAMLRAANQQQLDLFYTTPEQLYVESNKAKGILTPIKVFDDNNNWYQAGTTVACPLADIDIILMRKDPPFNMNYIYTTYLLELAAKDGALVANDPKGIRDANEKYFITQLDNDCIPPTIISQNETKLLEFWHEYKNVIIKPLDGMGGKGIFHIDDKGSNIQVVLEVLSQNGQTPIMAQQYIEAIKTSGDKRVLIIGDEIIPYSLARIPQGDDERGNLAKGAIGKVIPLSDKERALCQKVIPLLQKKGLYFTGLDIIGDYITEVNVTSPTCIVEIEKEGEANIAGRLIDLLIKKSKSL